MTPTGSRSYAPTWDAVWNEIVRLNCATEFCHAGSADYMILTSEEEAYTAIVGTPAQGPMCSPTGLLRVAPFEAGGSLLYLKVTHPPCGNKMPFIPGSCGLPDADVEQIGQWIACGAPDGDGGCAGAAADAGDAMQGSPDAAPDGRDGAPESTDGAAGDAGMAPMDANVAP